MNGKIKLAVFDLDGTLLNTLDDLAAACNAALREKQLPEHPVESYRYFVGNGIPKLMERILPEERRGEKPLLAGVREEFDRYYRVHNRDLTKPYRGIPELLEELFQRDVTMAVLSNKADAFTRELVNSFFPGRFAVIHGQRPGYPVKPDKSLTEELTRETGIPPQKTVYLGDSGVDMQTGKNAGFLTLGVLWGFRERKELLENGADALIETPATLLHFI